MKRQTACMWIVMGLLCGALPTTAAVAAKPDEAARGIIERLGLLWPMGDQLVLESIPADSGRDVFEIESREGKVVLRGSSGVAIASAFNRYLKDYCHCEISLWGGDMTWPDRLPAVAAKVRQVSPWKHRYYLNFCAFSYSLAWYDWPQWERLIDWMALQGINMPLSVTGEEAIWQRVYGDLGLTKRQLDRFFVGPAYLPFGWMGCIDGWAGPLPAGWVERHLALQKKIVARERELGMTPVLQGFTGHVPAALKEKFPEAKLAKLESWCGFPPTYFLDPRDPLFAKIGRLFIEEQTRQFGTDHLYAADTFIEMNPPSNDPKFLAEMGRGVYNAMRASDPEAVWVMQGWLFVYHPEFWRPPQAKALLGAAPNDRMIVLDLNCESTPVWSKTEGFYGKPWIWNVIQDYGNELSLHGGLPQMATDLTAAMRGPWRGQMVGIGMVNEGLGNNPVVNAFLSEMAWRTDVPALPEFVRRHAASRYGDAPAMVQEAWQLLLATAYRTPLRLPSMPCVRPAMMAADRSPYFPLPYDNAELVRAWGKLLDCPARLQLSDRYRFDVVHVGRQAMVNMAAPLHKEILRAYEKKDRAALGKLSGQYLELMSDLDELVATRKEFLLGRYLADATRWGMDDEQRKFYEWNARTMLTQWGPSDNRLFDYCFREWSGLVSDFYRPRWKMFFERLDQSLAEGKPMDGKAFDRDIRRWEEQWTHQRQAYSTEPHGEAVAVARRFYEKYGEFASAKPR
ncbi:MAG: alpha-N-acetylglucosaminidase [Planctomycetaceae bacterium]|nr:alpha-N-acetylglucosaminidase [Planctomycetaceae bacterium]